MEELKQIANGVDDAAVADYLRRTPDFFLRHAELLETLELRHHSGSAVSLIERQVEVLRGRSERLEARLQGLIEIAKDNEQRALRIHALARSLIRAPTLAASVLGLQERMREDFGIRHVFVGVQSSRLKRTDIDGLVRLDADGALARAFENFLRTKLLECGPLDEARARMLFPRAEVLPRSAAILPLDKERSLGMLVLADDDEQRFQPRQGKLFLEMTAELVSAVVRARLG